MAYDLLIKHGRIMDGAGRPGFRGDAAVQNDKIVEPAFPDGPSRCPDTKNP